MPVNDIFSKRQLRIRGKVPDVYQYETIPRELRVQALHIINRVFGQLYPYVVNTGDFDIDLIEIGHHQFEEHTKLEKEGAEWREFNRRMNYDHVHQLLCREYGVLTLGNSNDPCEAVARQSRAFSLKQVRQIKQLMSWKCLFVLWRDISARTVKIHRNI